MKQTRWSLIIAATQRSGSTLLGRALELTGGLGRPREWLQTSDREACLRAYGMSPDVPYDQSLQAIVNRETSPQGVFPLKVMWDTFEILLQRIAGPVACHGDPAAEWQQLCRFFPNPVFLFIQRRDKLKQAVSFVKSLQSGVWEERGQKPSMDENLLVFDPVAIAAAIAKFEQEDAAWMRFFSGHRLPFMEIVYEDFVADYEATLVRVFEFLGLPVPPSLNREAMDLKVMTNAVNKDWIRRFSALSQLSCAVPAPVSLPLEQLRLQPVSGAAVAVVCSQRFRYSLKLSNQSDHVFAAPCYDPVRSWTVLRAVWCDPVSGWRQLDAARAYCWQPLPAGAACTLECVLTAPAEPAAYRLEFHWERSTLSGTDIEQAAANATFVPTVNVALSEAEHAIRQWFPDSRLLLGNWRWIPWLGYFYMGSFPWICHADLGWFLFDPTSSSPAQYWFWETRLGWFHTAPDVFPLVYTREPPRVLRYAGKAGGICSFVDEYSGEVLAITPKFT